MRGDPIAAACLLDELAMAGVENSDAVVRATSEDQSIQLAHDARLIGVRQRAHLVAELFPIQLGDVLHVLERRIELGYAVLVVADANQQGQLAFDTWQVLFRRRGGGALLTSEPARRRLHDAIVRKLVRRALLEIRRRRVALENSDGFPED